MSFDIQFLGAASTVTGSKTLITTTQSRFLVDCGLFQGLKNLRLKNWKDFPVPPSSIDFVILTHAHIDHSGYLPRLVKQGFRGKVYCTSATRDLAELLLLDSAHLMEEEASYLNKKKKSKHNPALPLFTRDDVQSALKHFHVISFYEVVKISDEISFRAISVGHILGASGILLNIGQNSERRNVFFTGDVGRSQDAILKSKDLVPSVDILISEGTYGNSLHSVDSYYEALKKIMLEARKNNSTILVPAFAVGRAQLILHTVLKIKKELNWPMEEFKVYLNSPLAQKVTRVVTAHRDLLVLNQEEISSLSRHVYYIESVDESIRLNEDNSGKIIVAGSGMLTGGRVLHHIKRFASDPNTVIVLPGFQAPGTRGDLLRRGDRQMKIHGDYIDIKCAVVDIDSMSAHADRDELIKWFQDSHISPKKCFLIHGEPTVLDDFRRSLEWKLGWADCLVPEHEEIFNIT